MNSIALVLTLFVMAPNGETMPDSKVFNMEDRKQCEYVSEFLHKEAKQRGAKIFVQCVEPVDSKKLVEASK